MRSLLTLCSTAVLVALLSPGAHADEWNKRTYLTFSGPVEMPGVTLPAGTYTFELADPNAARHVIRVSQKETNKHIGLFMAIPMDRPEPPESNVIMFAERPAGSPQAVQAWFYPGDRTGEEFVYPRTQAARIAKANKTAVLATADARSARRSESESDRMAAMKNSTIGRVDERGEMKSDDRVAHPSPKVASSGSSSVGTTGASVDRDRSHRRSLPRTASSLPAVELLSVFALAGAFAVRRFRRLVQER
jgi:hypothetical protein